MKEKSEKKNEIFGYIYLITNMINGKQYIGQCTRNIKSSHSYYGSGTYMTRAIKKHDKLNFKKEILKENIHYQTALNIYEQIYIKKYNSIVPIGYNISLGGNGAGKMSDETKLKMSVRQLGEKNHMFGKHISIEQKEIISNTQKNNKHRLNKHHTSETKEKISYANKGKAAWNKGRHDYLTEEQIKKMSDSAKARKRLPQTEEQKLRHSEYMKIYWKNRHNLQNEK
jgi:group I intron endonuclease